MSRYKLIYINILKIKLTLKHKIMPIIVGIKIEIKVHLILPVSFLIVKQVVEQGKCISEKIMKHIAVINVQPLSTNNVFRSNKLLNSIKFPVAIYPIIIIGTTISLAGNPKIKDIKITPSNPIKLAMGSKKLVQ